MVPLGGERVRHRLAQIGEPLAPGARGLEGREVAQDDKPQPRVGGEPPSPGCFLFRQTFQLGSGVAH